MPNKTAKNDSDDLQTFRVRLSKRDVSEIRALARTESVRRGETILWSQLLRRAVRYMATKQKTVG